MDNIRSKPLVIDRFFTGLYTRRNPLFTPFRAVGISVSQYHDALIDGQNIEVSDNYTLQRRPGFPRFCSRQFSSSEFPLTYYSFRNLTGAVSPMVDTSANFYTFGTSFLTPLFTKGTTAQGFFQEVGNTLYYGNGIDQKKWDTQSVTNWGIVGPTTPPTIAGTGNAAFWQPSVANGGGGSYIVLDLNGNFQKTSAYNSTSTSTPIWATPFGSTTIDNTTIWTNRGPYVGWVPTTVTQLGTIIIDSNSNLQECTTAGTTGATTPTWAIVIGNTTTDGTVTWTMRGIGFYIPISTQGPSFPGTASGAGWTSPNNIKAADGAYASILISDSTTPALSGTNYGFSIPGGATITGIVGKVWKSSSRPVTDSTIQLYKAGVLVGTNKAGSGSSSGNVVTYGASSDLWGTSWSPADINNAGFGIGTAWSILSTDALIKVDYITLTVYYTTASGAAGTGQITAAAGYQYVTSYHAKSGNTSTASLPTYTTGPIIGQFTNTIQSTACADSQCDRVDFYRTADGGGIFYFLGSVANPGSGNVTFTDNAITDGALNTNVIAPVNDLNDPPPSVRQLASWQGRLWGVVGNKVFFNAGGDCTNGVPEEAWPPANVFVFPGNVNSIMPTSQGLLVFTSDAMFVILGGPQTLTFYTQHVLENFGVSSPNCVAQDGDQVYVFTTSRQLFVVNANGKSELGWNVGDQLLNFNPVSSYLALHRNGQDSGLFLSDGQANVLRYSLNLNCWSPIYTLPGGLSALQSIETAVGTNTLLAGRGAGSGYILGRNLSVFTDDGVTYPATVTMGSITLSQAGAQLVPIHHVFGYLSTQGSDPSLSIMFNEITANSGQGFIAIPGKVTEAPIGMDPSTTLKSFRWQVYTNQSKKSLLAHHIQLKLTFPAEAFKNEILAVGMKFDNQ